MKKRAVRVLLMMLILLLPTGCWSRREVEEQAYVVAIGVDAADEPGLKTFTFQIVIPNKMAGGGGDGGGGGVSEKSHFQTSIRSRSLFSARDALQATISRRITLLQCRAMLLGEKLARQGVLGVIRNETRVPELRRTLFLAVVPGEAKELLDKVEPKLQGNLNKYYEELTFSNEYTGFTTVSTINKLAKAIEGGGEDAVIGLVSLQGETANKEIGNSQAGELPRSQGESQEYLGVAVFRKDKMVGKLGKMETEVLNMINGDWHQGPYCLKDPVEPQHQVGLNLYARRKPDVQVDLSTNPATVHITLYMYGHLVSENGPTDYTTSENKIILEQAVERDIVERCRNLISKAQDDFKADIFRIGNHAIKKQFLTWQEWADCDWEQKFPEVQIDVSAVVEILSFGSQWAPIPVMK